MRKPLLLAAMLVAASLSPLARLAAQKTGVINGMVLDGTGRPVAGADVVASADNARTRSDSTGHFEIRNLDAGSYVVRARMVGYLPMRLTADLGHGGSVTVRFELTRRPAFLDTLVVTATPDNKCPDRSYVGFLCRKGSGKGLYMTDDDIFDKNARELGDIFRGVPGFRVELTPTAYGTIPVAKPTRASQCLNALVNGRPVTSTNPLPRWADEMIAVEIYALPSDAPDEYQMYVWGRTGRQSQTYRDHSVAAAGDRCSLVVYWTRFS